MKILEHEKKNVRPRRMRGGAILELTIMLPFLLLLIAGTIELGTAFMRYDILQKTVRDGARYLSVNTSESNPAAISAGLLTQTRNLIVYGNPGGTGTALLPSFKTSDVSFTSPSPGYIAVTGDYDYNLVLGGFLGGMMKLTGGSGFPVTIPMSSTTVMLI